MAFKANQAGIVAMAARPWMAQALVDHGASPIGVIAIDTSPFLTGEYQDSWRTAAGIEGGRAKARIVNICAHAGFVEFGTVNMRAQRVLGRAMEAAIARGNA